MTTASEPAKPQLRSSGLIDWLGPHLRWITVPSWVLSLIIHAIFITILIVVSQMPSCRGDFGGDGGESFRKVGIRQRGEQNKASEVEAEQPSEEQLPTISSPVVTTSAIPDQPPIPLPLPAIQSPSMPLLGAGPPPQFDATQFSSVIQPSQIVSGGAPPSGGPNDGSDTNATSFLGVSDRGRSFVYIIDRSSSMEDDGRLRAAKMELLSSLQQLDESQQFQIIFYNAKFTVLQPRSDKFNLFFGTDAQRLQVVEQLREIRPEGGTLHFPAVMRALKFRPDVIFLLTDGDPTSALTPSEQEEIRIENGGGTHIHCIEFGKGSVSVNGRSAKEGNFLDKLAQKNGGQYVYRDVTDIAGF
ncbi:MAG: hypothetical protein KDA69_18680 [Planctomycetaceae bacterium]|nr:hypothetical protein [Planctomycetaceae bacterium]MCA9046358.1 hypothetical protein [Planctomycetaceae bacterium]MCB9953996.1 hypothetical protein [Planctomycetaceae bacterium]